jgi:fumarate hydratase subunit beta
MERRLTTPLSRETAESLRVGDVAYISGIFIVARDKAHVRMAEYFNENRELPFNLNGAVIFHGAPVVKKDDGAWKIVAIGPTTSARMDSL